MMQTNGLTATPAPPRRTRWTQRTTSVGLRLILRVLSVPRGGEFAMQSRGCGQTKRGFGREDGVALIVALMGMLLMTALGLALVLTTTSETLITANFRNGQEAAYAADAVIERAMDDLLTVPDWNKLLDGTTQSAFVDGAAIG